MSETTETNNPTNDANQFFVNISSLERIACGAGGAAMMAVGLFRAAPGLAMAAAGAGLANRGACGHSVVYRKLGLSTARQAKKLLSDEPLVLERSIEVNAKCDEVLDLLTDPEAAREVFRRLDHTEPEDEEDELRLYFRQGAFRFDVDVLTQFEKTDDGATKITWLVVPDEEAAEGLAPSGSITLEPSDDGNRTEVRVKVWVATDDPRRKAVATMLTPAAHLWVGARLRRLRQHFRAANMPAEGTDPTVREVAEDMAPAEPSASQVA